LISFAQSINVKVGVLYLKMRLPKKIFQLSDFYKKILHSAFYILHSEAGFAGQLVMVLLLVAGIGVGTYLTQQRTNIAPKAADLQNECTRTCGANHANRTAQCINNARCDDNDRGACDEQITDCNAEAWTAYDTCIGVCKREADSSATGDNNGGDNNGSNNGGDGSGASAGDPGGGGNNPTGGGDPGGSAGGVDPVTGDPIGVEPVLPPFAGISLGYGGTIDETDFVSRLRRYKALIKSKLAAQAASAAKFSNAKSIAIAKATDKIIDERVKDLRDCMDNAGFTGPITVDTADADAIISKLKECEKKAQAMEREIKEDYRLAKFYQILANFGKNDPKQESCVKADLGYKEAGAGGLKHLNAHSIKDTRNPPEERRLFFCVGGIGDLKWRVNDDDGTSYDRLSAADAKLYQPIYANELPASAPKENVNVTTAAEIEKIRAGDKNAIEKMFSKTAAMQEVYKRYLKVRERVIDELDVKLD
jgi:hypothetical protein